MWPGALLLLLFVPAVAAAAPPAELTLEQGYALARARSETIALARQSVQSAELGTETAWSALTPTAKITGAGALQTVNRGLTGSVAEVQATGSVTQPLFRREIFSSVSAARLLVKSADLALARVHEQLYLDVANAFIGVLRARQQRQVSEAAMERAAAEEKSVAARVQAGGALRSAQLQATIGRRRAQFQVLAAERTVGEQEVAFERLLGVKPPDSLVLPETPKVPELARALELLPSRSDVRAAQERIKAARETEGTVAARLWPRLDATFQADLLLPRITLPSLVDPVGVRGTAVLTIPLFELDSHVQVRAQQVQTQVAVWQETQLVRQAAEEVSRATVQLANAEKQIMLAQEQLKDANDHYKLVSNQFALRAVSFLEVITSQASLTEAENQQLVARYDREVAAYQLLFASGTLGASPEARP